MINKLDLSSPFKYFLLGILILALGGFLGCSRDPEQRTAYKGFLQAILAKQGYFSLPPLTGEQEKAFGPYSLSYQQLYDFTKGIEKSVEECAVYMDGISKNISTPKDIMDRRDEIARARDYMALIPAKWDELLEQAKAQKEKLVLHEDVAPLYNELFIKYTEPVNQIKPLMLSVVDTLNSNIELADYLKQNEKNVQFQGNMIICNDEAVNDRINQLLADVNASAQKLYALENSFNHYLIINKD